MSSSPKLFNDYAEALNYIMIKNGASKDTLHYLDDFWSVSASKDEAENSLKIITDTIEKSWNGNSRVKNCESHQDYRIFRHYY